ncbi:MAG: thermonuclease family protein [Xanthobacteraceae bacterium]
MATFAAGLAAGVALAPALNGTVLPTPVSAATPAGLAPPPAYPAEVLSVVDGDTFNARVHAWPGIEIVTKVRLRGIDAPEHRARCDAERVKAQAAHDALVALFAEGDVAVTGISLDKYGGRVLARASTRRVADVSAALLQAGLVRSYSGGRREGWC